MTALELVRRRIHRGLARLAVLAAVLLTLWIVVGASAAQAADADWELLGPGEAVFELFTPTSGAFFARTATALLRSDDAGLSWQPVNLPPTVPPNLPPPTPSPESVRRAFAVDPTDHSIIFTSDVVGLLRTTDGGETWTSLSIPSGVGQSVQDIVVSPADHQRIYVQTFASETMSGQVWNLRSDDGGTTWTITRYQSAGPSCAFGYPLFQAQPSDPNRLFRVGGCSRGVSNGEPVERSMDGGQTWKRVTTFEMGNVRSLVGGQGAQPNRFYLAVIDRPQHTARLFRSDDDLASLTPVLDVPDATSVVVTYDPAAPDRVIVGTSGGGVQESADAGQTWAPLGQQDLGAIHDLALGIDGANLYAATDQGIWRYALAADAP